MTEDYEPPLDTSPEALERLARDHETVANDPKHLVMGHPHHAKTAAVLRALVAEREARRTKPHSPPGPYEACHTSKDTHPYCYGVSGPGPGLGYNAWLGYPQNTFENWDAAEKAARLMNLAFREGQARRSREIKSLLG